MDILLGVLEQGLIYGILALGLYITYTILNFPDLTVDGSFPLGAAVSVSLILKGVTPIVALMCSLFVGALAGMITGLIHVKLGVRDLLSGIIVMTGLYTINLTIAGQANVPIFNSGSIFNNIFTDFLEMKGLFEYKKIVVIMLLALLVKFSLDFYLRTKSGFLLKSAGGNPTLVKTMAKDPGMVKIIGLSLANAMVAFSGAILAQHQRFFEISMGTGSMVIGLASVIIGMKLLNQFDKMRPTTKVLIGSIIYRGIVAAAIQLGLGANSMKLITAVLFLVILVINRKEEEALRHA